MVNKNQKIIVITGATSGIGFKTAFALANLGCKVIIIGKDNSKGIKAVNMLNNINGSNTSLFYNANLSVMNEISELANILNNELDKIDVLINNVGAIFTKRTLSTEGIEMTFALNHLSYFLFTNLLLNKIKNSNIGRIINVSSVAHLGAKLNIDDIECKKNYNLGWKAYSNSKLLNILFTYYLSQNLSKSHITVNSLHPGFINSNFGSNNSGFFTSLFNLYKNYAGLSLDEGAKTSVYLASSKDVDSISGNYYVKSLKTRSSKISYDLSLQKKVWNISYEYLSKFM